MRTTSFLLALLALLAGCATAPGSDSPGPPPVPVAAAAPPETLASAPVAVAEATAPQVPASAAAPALAASESAPTATDPLRPDERVDLDDRSARLDLWERVRNGFAMPDLDNDLVREHEQWYASRPDYVQRMTERGARYLFHIVEEVDRRGLPTELALLPFIESAFNPQATSHAKASGMWQFMPGTGRDFELAQNVFRDDRRSILASTRAALDYLERLHAQFGDWQLALAAYNWGEGNVQRAIRANERKGLPADYEHLRMPAETRNYLPKLQAVKNIVAEPARFALALPPLDNHPYFLMVPIERDIDVEIAAELAALDLETFHQLNPQHKKPVILAAGTPHILLPYDSANAFVRNLALHDGKLASWTAWVAPKTMKPSDVAKKVGMSEARLREVNRIPPRMLVRAGSTLLVPRNGHADVAVEIADNATMLLAPEHPARKKVKGKVRVKGGKGGKPHKFAAKTTPKAAASAARPVKLSETAGATRR